MNILTQRFPTKTIIDEKEYTLNTDFRNCLNIILAFEDNELLDVDKIDVMLELLYGKDNIPKNVNLAIEKAILFLDCGEISSNKSSEGMANRLYSFKKDAKYIYSAIRQTHKIDLENIEYLHWWKFVYMFLDLDPNCFFCKMLDLRNKKIKGKFTTEERKLYLQLYDILEIENNTFYSEDEQNEINEFMTLLNGGKENEKDNYT